MYLAVSVAALLQQIGCHHKRNLEVLSSPKTIFRYCSCVFGSRDSSVGIATRYGVEGLGIQSRQGEIFRTCPDRLRGPPSLLYNGYRLLPWGKGGWAVMLTTHPLLVPRLRKSCAIPPLTLWVLLGLLRDSLYLSCVFANSSGYTSLGRPIGLQKVEDPRISRQLAHEDGIVVSPTHRPPLHIWGYTWSSFLLRGMSTSG